MTTSTIAPYWPVPGPTKIGPFPMTMPEFILAAGSLFRGDSRSSIPREDRAGGSCRRHLLARREGFFFCYVRLCSTKATLHRWIQHAEQRLLTSSPDCLVTHARPSTRAAVRFTTRLSKTAVFQVPYAKLGHAV